MARSGYAAQSTYPPGVKNEEEIREATHFAQEHRYGLWSGCATDEEGDTNEPFVLQPEGVAPDEVPVCEETVIAEPVQSSTRAEQVITADPVEALP
jgi:hypothetical protein